MATGLESNSFVLYLRKMTSRVFAGISLGFYAMAAMISPGKRLRGGRSEHVIDLKGHRGLRESIETLIGELSTVSGAAVRRELIAKFLARMVTTELAFDRCAIFLRRAGFFYLDAISSQNGNDFEFEALKDHVNWLPLPLSMVDPDARGIFRLDRIPDNIRHEGAMFGGAGLRGQAFLIDGEPGSTPSDNLDLLYSMVVRTGHAAGVPIPGGKMGHRGILAVTYRHRPREEVILDLKALAAFARIASLLFDDAIDQHSLDLELTNFLLARIELSELLVSRERDRNKLFEQQLAHKQEIIDQQWESVRHNQTAIEEALQQLREKGNEVERVHGEKVVLEARASGLLEIQSRSSRHLRELEAANTEYHIFFSILRHSYGNMVARIQTQRLGLGSVMKHMDLVVAERDLRSRARLVQRLDSLDPLKIDRFVDDFVRHHALLSDCDMVPGKSMEETLGEFLSQHSFGVELESMGGSDQTRREIVDDLASMTIKRLHGELMYRIRDFESDQQRLDGYLNRVFAKLVNGKSVGKGSCDVVQVGNELMHKCRKMYRSEYKGTIQFEFFPLSSVDGGLRIPMDEPTFIIDVFNNLLRNALIAAITQDGNSSRGLLSSEQLKAMTGAVPGSEELVSRIFKPWEGEGSHEGSFFQIVDQFENLAENLVVDAFQTVFAQDVDRSIHPALDPILALCNKYRYVLSPGKLAWFIQRSLRQFGESTDSHLSERILDLILSKICSTMLYSLAASCTTAPPDAKGIEAIGKVLGRTLAERRFFWMSIELLRADDQDLVEIRVGDNIIGIPDDLVLYRQHLSADLKPSEIQVVFNDPGKKYLILKQVPEHAERLVRMDPSISQDSRVLLLDALHKVEPRKRAIFKGYMTTSNDQDLDSHGKGLLTVARAAQEVGGSMVELGIWGQGAEFVMQLPRVTPEETDPAVAGSVIGTLHGTGLTLDGHPELKRIGHQLEGKKILVVEDSVELARHVCSIFERVGKSRTMVAGSVSSAVRQLSGAAYDAITLDLDLGDSYGTDLLQLLHTGQIRNLSIPVIIVSTHVQDRFIREICEAYPMVKGLLAKPFTDQDLLLTMARVLDGATVTG